MMIQTWYGNFEVEQVFEDIVNTKEMKRLGKINQYGAIYQLYPQFGTTRLEHSLGVMALLRSLGADISEQIAGLLHDISHTAFSHVIDFVLGDIAQNISYHEQIAEKVLHSGEIYAVLTKHGIDPHTLMLYEKGPSLLERDMPDLCADRLDYMIRDLYTFGLLQDEDVNRIIDCIAAIDGTIVFKNSHVAEFFARKIILANAKIWNNPYQIYLATQLSEMVKIALEIQDISEDDLLSTDNRLFRKLQNSSDSRIVSILHQFRTSLVVELDDTQSGAVFHTKARYIDPWIIVGSTQQRLTKISPEYEADLNAFVSIHNQGYYLKVRERKLGEQIIQ